MSQVEAVNDNVTEDAATQPSVVMTRPPGPADDPGAPKHGKEKGKTAASGGSKANSRWPLWPNAWPDGSRQS